MQEEDELKAEIIIQRGVEFKRKVLEGSLGESTEDGGP
jgi:hypothetical protein